MIKHQLFAKGDTIHALISTTQNPNILFPVRATIYDVKFNDINPQYQIRIKNLYDNDLLRIIQSVGYPSQNKSHFASTDIYSTANDGNSWNNGNNSGWIGRFMESYYADLIQNSYPLGVEIGSKSNSTKLVLLATLTGCGTITRENSGVCVRCRL
mgnify:CR=1 FL=1